MSTKGPSCRSAGMLALRRTGKSQVEIARAFGVSGPTAHDWWNGHKRPGPENRVKARALYGIPEGAWFEADDGGTELAVVEDPGEGDAASAGGAFAMAYELQKLARQVLRELQEDQARPLDERDRSLAEATKAMGSLVATIAQLAKLTGQYDLGRRLLVLPIWKRIEAALREAIRPCPECQERVATMFETLDASTRGEG